MVVLRTPPGCGSMPARGRSHVQPVASESGGDALLAFEDAAQGGPTGVFAVGAQPGADDLDELVGDDGDEQMAVLWW